MIVCFGVTVTDSCLLLLLMLAAVHDCIITLRVQWISYDDDDGVLYIRSLFVVFQQTAVVFRPSAI